MRHFGKITFLFRANTIDPAPTRPWLLVLILFALALRAAFCLSRPVDESAMFRSLPDQREYLELGRNLLEKGRLSMIDSRFGDEVRAFRTPGYPLFVAMCGGSVRAVQMAQCAIDASTVLAVFWLARRWMGYWRSFLAATFVALNPFLVYFCSCVLTESTFVAMLAWGTALFAWSGAIGPNASRRRMLWWLGAIMLALSIHVRPAAIALPLLLGIGATLIGESPLPARRSRFALPVGASLVLLTIVALFPWAARNRMVLGSWVWTSTNNGFTLYDGLNPDADGSSDQSFVARLPELSAMNELARSQYLADRARQFAVDHPRRVIELAGRKLARLWSPIPLSAEFGGRWQYRVASAGYAVPLMFLAVLAAWRGSLARSVRVFLLLPAVYFSVSHAVTVGSMRYRVPAEPMLAVLAVSVGARRESAG